MFMARFWRPMTAIVLLGFAIAAGTLALPLQAAVYSWTDFGTD
jgi:hypothetical protein